jgi:4-amino-4-deoxy-L-arabinose transferase-like glycosyltransferase
MRSQRGGWTLRLLLLVIGAGTIFLTGLGRLPLFGRDEALYAEAAREMLASGDWITPRVNGAPFLEKPPLYYWLAAAGFKVFGPSPFAARLPAALMAMLTVVLTAATGARVWGKQAGLLAGIALVTSLQMTVIGRMGIMDVPLACLTMLAIVSYARWRERGGVLPATSFGTCCALAILLKGAAGLIPAAVATVDALIRLALGQYVRLSWRSIAAVAAAVVFAGTIASPWFLLMQALHGQEFSGTLLLREHLTRLVQPMQGHGGPPFYYVVLILLSFFPWVVFLPGAAVTREHEDGETKALWRSLSLIWIGCVLVAFSLIKTKLPGYVTPLFPPMALLVGAELDRRLERPGRGPWVGVLVGAIVLGGLVSLLPLAGARVGARVGASEQAWALAVPAALWVGGYGITALGAAIALAGRARPGLTAMAAGQAVILGAVLGGVLPVLSPHLEGGRESRLAELSASALPDSEVVLYDTRPEAVAFVLQRTVPCYGRAQWQEVLPHLEAGPTALIASDSTRKLWGSLPVRRFWRVGDSVLLDVPRTKR